MDPTRPEREYTNLSYCWRSQPPLSSSLDTYQSLKDGIPWAQIPRLFQDVMEITHQLGIRHVWIDSLCIIQNDPKDRGFETERMAEVYNNAYVTIASGFYPEVEIPSSVTGALPLGYRAPS